MARQYRYVMQFMVALEAIKPTIWRRFQVPDTYTFWDLHVALQDVLGWADYHLHEFTIREPGRGKLVRISWPDEEGYSEQPILTGWELRARDYFIWPGTSAEYLYDFGDDWKHRVELEAVIPAAAGVRYPICVGGERACPPEDCGGVSGYRRLLRGDRALREWAGDYDREAFAPELVKFSNPKRRWERTFGGE